MSVDTLANALNRNTATFLEGDALDYIPIAVSNSGKGCLELIEMLKAKDKKVLDLQAMKWKEWDVH